MTQRLRGDRVFHLVLASEEEILVVPLHSLGTDAIVAESSWILLVVVQDTLRLLFTDTDVGEPFQVLILRIDHVNETDLAEPMPVASPCRLSDGIQSSSESDDRTKINVDTRLDQLRAEAQNRPCSFRNETPLDLVQYRPAVRRAHAGAEMVDRRTGSSLTQAVERARGLLGIHDDKAATGATGLAER